MGCGATLVLDGERVVCGLAGCPDQAVAHKVLTDPETEHIVVIDGRGWFIRHPLRERVGIDVAGTTLEDCRLHGRLRACGGPPVVPGRYRVIADSGPATIPGWRFERIYDDDDDGRPD